MNIFGVILEVMFYVLLFYWVFFKINNYNLIKRKNIKGFVKYLKKNIVKDKFSKILFIIMIISFVISWLYLIIGVLLVLGICFITLATLGVIMLEVGDGFVNFIVNYFGIFKYIFYYVMSIVFIRSIYINIFIYSYLKNNE